MATQAGKLPEQEEVQSGKKVAFGLAATVIGFILLLLLLKYLIG